MPVRFQPANVLLDAGVTLLIHATCHMPHVSRDSKGCVRPRTCCDCCCLWGGSIRSTVATSVAVMESWWNIPDVRGVTTWSQSPSALQQRTVCVAFCRARLMADEALDLSDWNSGHSTRSFAATAAHPPPPFPIPHSQSHFPTPLSHTHESPCSAGSEEGGRPRGGAAGADRQEAGVCHQGRAEADCRRHHPQYDQGDSGDPRAPPCSEWATVLR